MVLGNADSIGETLVMHDLSRAQVLDDVAHVRVITQAKNVVVGHASLLLCYYHVFATKLSLAKARKSI